MTQATKIATCTYCGTRTAIVLSQAARHELTCSACGAPLDRMELLHTAQPAAEAPVAVPIPLPAAPKRSSKKKTEEVKKRSSKSAGFGLSWPEWNSDDDDDDDDDDDKSRKSKKSKKRKKRKSLAKKLFKEAADKIEDIFD